MAVKIDLSMLLSCQRSAESLNKTMGYVIQELFGDLDYRFYIANGSHLRHEYELYCHSQHEFDEVQDKEQLTDLEFAEVSDFINGTRFFPAISNDKIWAMLLTPDEINADIERHLTCLLAIYCNVLNLISDSKVDGLTGLGNRKSFDADLLLELEHTAHANNRRQSDAELPNCAYLALLDIDRFKQVNDRHGHLIGDEVLLTLAQKIKANFRDQDGLYRYGGEEFAIILKEIDDDSVDDVLKRFVAKIRTDNFPTVGHITVSIGYCRLDTGDAPSIVISKADKALYYSKKNGRDQVSDYKSLLSQGLVKESEIDTDIELF